MFDIIERYHSALLGGLWTTLKLCISAWLIGFVAGSGLGFIGSRFPQSIGRLVSGMAFFLSAFPLLILLYWVHYPGQAILHINVGGYWTSLFVLSVAVAFSVAEILKQALLRFSEDFMQAALVCGLTPKVFFLNIQLPLIVRYITPGLLTVVLLALHGSLFASMISVSELFRTAQQINAIEYKPIEVYGVLAFLFLVICLPLHGAALTLHRWSDRLFT